uniref:hypothetical protein n=1 Tax=Actinacidiphila rubida TaxID=310780 RepID=UPI0008498A18
MTHAGHDRIADLAIAALHEPDPDALWRSIAEEVLGTLGADLLVHKEDDWTPERGAVRLWEPTESLGADAVSGPLRAAIRRCYPVVDHYLVSGDPAPVSAGGIIGDARWRGTAFATIAREELGARDVLTIPFPDTEEPLRGWLLLRTGSPFTPAEVDGAHRLQPLLCGVERQCRTLRRLRTPPPQAVPPAPGPAAGQAAGPIADPAAARAVGPAVGPAVAAADPVRLAAEHGLTPRETAVLTLLAGSGRA